MGRLSTLRAGATAPIGPPGGPPPAKKTAVRWGRRSRALGRPGFVTAAGMGHGPQPVNAPFLTATAWPTSAPYGAGWAGALGRPVSTASG
ncbi:MAG: hypothetical protein WKG07_11875 [Hymenobacter sp.]